MSAHDSVMVSYSLVRSILEYARVMFAALPQYLSDSLERIQKRVLVIDLFGLYILFSHFRPRDATRGNSFFQMSSYARANLRITNEKTKGKFP